MCFLVALRMRKYKHYHVYVLIKVAGMLINMHNIHNLWSPQKCASVNAVQTGLCVELRHLAIARAQTCIRDCNADVTSWRRATKNHRN